MRKARGSGFDPQLRCLNFSFLRPSVSAFFLRLVCWNGLIDVVPVEKTTFASLVEMICGASELSENIPAPFKRTLTREDFQGTRIFLSRSSSTSREDAGRSEVPCALDVKSSCLAFGRSISIEFLHVENVPNAKVVGPDAFSRMISASKSLATQLEFPKL